MKDIVSLLPMFFSFWFFEAPKGLVLYFASLNKAFLTLFSLPLFLRTFFQPLKNEYRGGLVAFSIGMGMVVKSMFILVDLLLLLILLSLETVFFISFILLPFATVALLFVKI